MPASSAMRARSKLSDQFPDHRSATRVTARPDEQLAPNRPILSALALYIAIRSCKEAVRASTFSPDFPVVAEGGPPQHGLASIDDDAILARNSAPRAPMNRYRFLCAAIAVLIALCAPAAGADAQGRESYPTRPIHIIVPFPPGGPADILARIIGAKMTRDWGQAVIVENRSGANTVIGAQAVARAVPDGYTLLMAIDSTL